MRRVGTVEKADYIGRAAILFAVQGDCREDRPSMQKVVLRARHFRECKRQNVLLFQVQFVSQSGRLHLCQEYKRIPHFVPRRITLHIACCQLHWPSGPAEHQEEAGQ